MDLNSANSNSPNLTLPDWGLLEHREIVRITPMLCVCTGLKRVRPDVDLWTVHVVFAYDSGPSGMFPFLQFDGGDKTTIERQVPLEWALWAADKLREAAMFVASREEFKLIEMALYKVHAIRQGANE